VLGGAPGQNDVDLCNHETSPHDGRKRVRAYHFRSGISSVAPSRARHHCHLDWVAEPTPHVLLQVVHRGRLVTQ